MIDKVGFNRCCLCRACSESCPVSAIKFNKEYHGFYYPSIDSRICIKCKKCEKVCPSLNKNFKVQDNHPIVYGGKSFDDENRKESSSGGIFFEIARLFIQNGGYVAGAVFDNNCHLKHIVSNDITIVKKMRGSKYVQSNNKGEFIEIKKLLKENKVLFCGCPCQVAGLRHFLGKNIENLYTIDFICHGIPSQSMLDEYIQFRESREKSKIIEIKFRDKSTGWHRSSLVCVFENGNSYCESITSDPYMRGYFSGYNMKESCYYCKYKNSTSGSDLTLADLWGAEVICTEMDDNKGLSIIISNTNRGDSLLENLSIEKNNLSIEEVIKYNKNYLYPTKKNENANFFWDSVYNKGYQYSIKKFFCESTIKRFKKHFRYRVRCFYYKIRGKGKPLY